MKSYLIRRIQNVPQTSFTCLQSIHERPSYACQHIGGYFITCLCDAILNTSKFAKVFRYFITCLSNAIFEYIQGCKGCFGKFSAWHNPTENNLGKVGTTGPRGIFCTSTNSLILIRSLKIVGGVRSKATLPHCGSVAASRIF
jgi:hypothetical protein